MVATLNYQRIEWVSAIPAGWEQICIRGSHIGSWEGEAGIIMTETITVDVFSLLVVSIFLRSSQRIELRLDERLFYFLFCIEDQWLINEPKAGNIIKKNQYQLLVTDAIQIIPHQVPGRMSQLLIISSQSVNFCNKKISQRVSVNASASMMNLLLQLIQSSYFPKPRAYHEKLILDVIKIATENNEKEKLPPGKLNNIELEALYKVSMLIEKDLMQHHSIAELAIYSGMNRDKLTSSFKSLFGQSIYTYYLTRRMELAKDILINSDLPIKLVSKKAGYHNTTNFSIAFKKFFNITPAQMRSKKPD